MKILFDNLLISSALTSEHASNNYPVDNLKDTSLIKRLQSSIDHDLVTSVLAATSTISDFWYAFTTATQIILRLYDAGAGLLYTETIAAPVATIDHIAFTPVANVHHATIYFEGGADVYLGGIGFGQATTMPDPLAQWKEPDTDNSAISESPFGQSNQDFVEALRGYEFGFANLTRAQINAIQTLIRSVGVGRPLWMDFFELNHGFVIPIYAKIAAALAPAKDARYSFSLTIKEAK